MSAVNQEHEEARQVELSVTHLCSTYGVKREDVKVNFLLTPEGSPQYEIEFDLPVPITRVKSVITVVHQPS